MAQFLENHSGELIILVLCAMLLGTLLIVVPQLLRAHARTAEMFHEEQMRALEQGQPLVQPDIPARMAGRATVVVPCVVVCAAGTVTCFLAAYKSENVTSVSLAVWAVAGVVSLAAITGGVALMGRLAQLQADQEEEEVPYNPLGR
ncbi:MAG TPA: hypothetical protein VFA18_05535 [Gemmataceae bacterium]|nr:hypothetical protein [Gemmataceae bacterium]